MPGWNGRRAWPQRATGRCAQLLRREVEAPGDIQPLQADTGMERSGEALLANPQAAVTAVRDGQLGTDGRRGAPPGASPAAELQTAADALTGTGDQPDGLIHHWRGAAFLADATVDTALQLSRSYAQYSTVYESVVSSELIDQEGDTFRVRLRIRERAGVVTSVVDIISTVTYGRVDACSGYSVSHATEIREIVDAGQPGERALPAGTGHGYLWRASTFSSYRQQDGGLYLSL